MNRECSDGLEDPSSSEEKAILSESGLEQQRRKKAMSRKSQTLLVCLSLHTLVAFNTFTRGAGLTHISYIYNIYKICRLRCGPLAS